MTYFLMPIVMLIKTVNYPSTTNKIISGRSSNQSAIINQNNDLHTDELGRWDGVKHAWLK